jgi:hypothetical protein
MVDRSLNQALADLESAVRENNVHAMDGAIAKLALFKSPSSIKPLLCLLSDSFSYDEGMYSLVHAAEAFDDAVYIQELLSALPILRQVAPSWAAVVVMRVLNNESTRQELIRQVSGTELEAKASLAWLLEQINKKDPVFVSKTVGVLLAANN